MTTYKERLEDLPKPLTNAEIDELEKLAIQNIQPRIFATIRMLQKMEKDWFNCKVFADEHADKCMKRAEKAEARVKELEAQLTDQS